MNNEIIKKENNGLIEQTYKYERVNFDAPASIISYGDEAKNEISTVLEKSAKTFTDTRELTLTDEQLKGIYGFDDELREASEKAKKKELPAITTVKNFLTKLGVKKFEEEKEKQTYKGRYEEYCKLIEEVCEVVKSQKDGSIHDIELRNKLIEEMLPHIEMLEEMIKVGRQDQILFQKEVDALRDGVQSIDTEYEYQYKSQLLEVFNGRLNELEKAVVLYKQQIQTYRVQQRSDMEAAMNADSYLRDQAPILKAQGSVMVFNHQQEKRIQTLKALNEATNRAIEENAEALELNAQGAVDLALNGGINIESLRVLNEAISRGVEIIRTGKEQKQLQIEEERQQLESINSTLDDYQRDLFGLIDNKDVIEKLAIDTRTKNNPRVKSLTMKKK